MRRPRMVTILGTQMVLVLLFIHCGPGERGVQKTGVLEVGDSAAPAIPAAGDMEVSLAEAIRCYEEGDLEHAARLVDEILIVDPQHEAATMLLQKLRSMPFCTVYPGDTLGEIAGYYYREAGKWTVLVRANGIGDPNKVKAYQRIRIPPLSGGLGTRCEADRIRSRFFGGIQPGKILSHEVRQGERMEAVAEKHYGDRRLASFLADYNHLDDPVVLTPGSTLLIPSFPRRTKEAVRAQEMLEEGIAHCQKKDYRRACETLASVPNSSTHYENAQRHLGSCRTEGASHYEALGDEALRASEPERAHSLYREALELNPERKEIRRKLDEISDMLKAMDLLGSVPESRP